MSAAVIKAERSCEWGCTDGTD